MGLCFFLFFALELDFKCNLVWVGGLNFIVGFFFWVIEVWYVYECVGLGVFNVSFLLGFEDS